MRIALVHDWLNTLGGAERVLIELHKIFPEAPIYTLFASKKFIRHFLPDADIRPSFLNKPPFITKFYKYLALIMPVAVESFDLSDYDLVISSSVNFSKGLVLKPKTWHICYCYSPMRQIWDLNSTYNQQFTTNNFFNRMAKHFLRIWDRQTADRVDEFIAISEHVRERIGKYYRKEAVVIYPPVSNFQFSIFNFQSNYNDPMSENYKINEFNENFKLKIKNLGNYYLIVSRLYKHKNIDVAVEAFSKLRLPLVIIGTGPEKESIQNRISGFKNIKMLGFIPDEELGAYYQNCRAFIMPQEEDFGITPIEAMSFGKPVLALRKGGATETVVEGVTGEFFDDPIPEALADGVRRLNGNYPSYSSEAIKMHAQKFSSERFRKEILKLIDRV
ncbi:MAG: hypothetical protein A2925_02655 [Candidatus Yanofskybacteria bacterium RIFCSPLOWO2_01_FULL_44_22]|uniref:Glycosyl transferase family 1 domain-containing protein n=2 Tax=Candidatus Yanofskyibacteriota TaxID=1752733 RepID=A0A1F8GMN5_9BACT|nr:MAG: Glycosyl transferase group 1 [Candidatus Yanofskybacteria bacterium GW2011_GWA2_44_9]OGN04190.1 MAG: hypothetical protein A2659_01735 [Candidatus Yanofskybacteria bacterium RIFCSPHIGHO2_01_FULL_44_24]OGN25916.1 MAG: hypothetical protein A2925_02655 [Candidatus Yanofskybacteria bacterium RIFCSPLOWO2_01_FULL_44_22]